MGPVPLFGLGRGRVKVQPRSNRRTTGLRRYSTDDLRRRSVTGEKEFQEKIRQLGALVAQLDQLPGNGSGVAAREMVQLLMDVHGTALNRMMEIAFESGAAGSGIIAKFGNDPMVRNLLLLYSLHPDDLETRILQAVENAGRQLRKLDAKVEVLSMQEGNLRLRLQTSGHACGSTAAKLQAAVEECVYEMAPDLASLEFVTPQDEPASGFFPLAGLMKQSIASPVPAGRSAEMEGAD